MDDKSTIVVAGRVQNGVVVLDTPNALPEGASVRGPLRSTPVIHAAKNQQRVEFPLVPSDVPGSIDLTNERIAEILAEENIEAVTRSWDVPS